MKTIVAPRLPAKLAAIIAFALFIAVLISLLVGCFRTTLDPSGVYRGDAFLSTADQTIGDASDAINNFLIWETANRSSLTGKLHSVTVAADSIRRSAPVAFTNAVAARNLYSNSVALARGPTAIAQASNSLAGVLPAIQTQTLSLRAITNSVNF